MAEADSGLEAPRRPGAKPLPRRRFFELFALAGFAFAQPLLDVTGRSPETFLFYRIEPGQIVVYALMVVFGPPLLAWSLIRVFEKVSLRAGRVAYATFAGAFVALVAGQAAKKLLDVRGIPIGVLAIAISVGAVVLFARSALVRTFVSFLIPAPIIFALLFLLTSPTAELIRPADRDAAVAGSGGFKPPVVMIVLDEFPLASLLNSKGEIDERVFPNFAQLAQTSNWYRNATGVSSFTQYAVPALLTGRYPKTKAAPSYVEHPDNLFSLLAPDYRIVPFETITQLCDPALCEAVETPRSDTGLRGLLGQTWRVAVDLAKPYDSKTRISDQFAEETAAEQNRVRAAAGDRKKPRAGPDWDSVKANQPRRFQRFVSGLTPSENPTLHFLHLLMPHTPWRYLPSGTTYPDKVIGGVRRAWGPHAYPMEVNRQRHLLQVAYTDRLLGVVMSRLKSQGIWDEALVVVTADHGESFLPGTSGRRLITEPEDEAQIAWVPMFIKKPKQTSGETSDANWEHVDLLPTMAEAIGVEPRFKMDGISHFSAKRKRTDKYFYNEPTERITFAGPPAFNLVRQGITDTLVRGASGQRGLYEMGPRRDWIGQRVAGLGGQGVDIYGPRSAITAQLAPEINLDQVDPASGSVPALMSGTLKGSSGGESVAIAVNGTVAAVSEIWPEQGEPSFAGMVNDALFKAGKNELALYEVAGGRVPQLRPITLR